jgi:hypothetical protein
MPDLLASRRIVRPQRPGVAGVATALAAVLLIAGALVWFKPFLTARRQPVASVPEPAALFAVTPFTVRPGEQACMSAVALEPDARVAEFQLRPVRPVPQGGPPVDLVLSAPGYRAVLAVPGGYPGGSVALPITPPRHTRIGTACFVNRGRTAVNLIGTSEPRTVSRSTTTIGGRSVVGDIALTFAQSGSSTLLERLGEAFRHASNLTDGLVPVWLIWVLTALVVLGVPLAIFAAFYLAMREDLVVGRL